MPSMSITKWLCVECKIIRIIQNHLHWRFKLNYVFKVLIISLGLFLGSTTAYSADWSYEVKKDKMSGETIKLATLASDNTLKLSPPYDGENNYGMIFVRQTGHETVNVYIAIEKGQILCPGYGDGCSVTVRFDDKKPTSFRAIGPNDYSSTAFFIGDARRFVAASKLAKEILIQFPMYSAGNQILEFHSTQSLKWDAKVRSKK